MQRDIIIIIINLLLLILYRIHVQMMKRTKIFIGKEGIVILKDLLELYN